MSTKKINAGDTLTVGDLTDDHLGAVIEVGVAEGTIYKMTLRRIEDNRSTLRVLAPEKESEQVAFSESKPVTVIAPPPVVQPDEPTELGQCIRIEGDDEFRGVVVDPEDGLSILSTDAGWMDWEKVLGRAGHRQIIVSDPPRWPDETPDVPERIEKGEWPDDDTHLREWEWIGHLDYRWRWYAEETRKSGWAWTPDAVRRHNPSRGPWPRGERVK